MRVFYFSEGPHTPAYDNETGNLRAILPNEHFDTAQGGALLNRYLDEAVYAARAGLDVMSNEQWSTATCGWPSAMMQLAILARQTENARLLCLGVPVGAHGDPVKVAEQAAWVDVVSGGRLELGLVKGGAALYLSTNANPAHSEARFQEARRLIVSALSSHGEPLNWEGEHFQFRQVNIWPRPMQEQIPIWATALSPFGGRAAAEEGYICATALSAAMAKVTFGSYAERRAELGLPFSTDMLAHNAYVAIAPTREAAERKMRVLLQDFYYRGWGAPQLNDLPGMKHVKAYAATARQPPSRIGGRTVPGRDRTPVDIFDDPMGAVVKTGLVFAGTPDDVVEQITEFGEFTGGFGHLLAAMGGGRLTHEDTIETIDLMASQVMPRLAVPAASV